MNVWSAGRWRDGEGISVRRRRETRTKERGERAGELRFVMERKNSRVALVGTRLSRSPPERERERNLSLSRSTGVASVDTRETRDAPRDRVLSLVTVAAVHEP